MTTSHWFDEARFGLFIHWGLYALPARGEWVRHHEQITNEDYQKYFDHFYPDLFEPGVWAEEAWNAGMRYVVVTSKHHDGFCLWDSQATEYKATNTPWGKDLFTPIVAAFRARQMRIGLYHSLLDWHHPAFTVDNIHPQRDDPAFIEQSRTRDMRQYTDYLHRQTREILTGFGRIDILWYDFSYSQTPQFGTGKGKADWESEKLLTLVRSLQPNILVNDRLEIGGDITTPEQFIPREGMKRDGERIRWESCQTMNEHWGYARDDDSWKPVELLVRNLIEVVSKGGNLLLNVGPDARGQFPPQAIERMRDIGRWMRLHNRAIYGCGPSEFTPPPDCRYTQNGKRLYAHLFAWPYRILHLPGLAGKVEYAQMLHDGSEIRAAALVSHVQQEEAGYLSLELPTQQPDVLVPVLELFLK